MSQRSARNDAAAQSASKGARSAGSGEHRVVSKGPSATSTTIQKAAVPSPQREQASVQEYFDRFAVAMTSGDMKAMTRLWGVPAFVIGTHEARVVQSEAEIEQFFSGAKQLYTRRGIVGTRAEIVDLDWIDQELVMATVRWPYLDQNDRTIGEESSTYTLLRGEDGSFKLRVITFRGPARAPEAADTETEDGTDGE